MACPAQPPAAAAAQADVGHLAAAAPALCSDFAPGPGVGSASAAAVRAVDMGRSCRSRLSVSIWCSPAFSAGAAHDPCSQPPSPLDFPASVDEAGGPGPGHSCRCSDGWASARLCGSGTRSRGRAACAARLAAAGPASRSAGAPGAAAAAAAWTTCSCGDAPMFCGVLEDVAGAAHVVPHHPSAVKLNTLEPAGRHARTCCNRAEADAEMLSLVCDVLYVHWMHLFSRLT